MTTGTRFTLTGWYTNGDECVMVADEREKTDNGSRVIRSWRTGETHPATAAGARRAQQRSADLNATEARRLKSE